MAIAAWRRLSARGWEASLLAHIIGFNIKRIKLIIDFLWIVLGTNRKRHTEKYQHDIYVFPFCLKQYPVHKFVL